MKLMHDFVWNLLHTLVEQKDLCANAITVTIVTKPSQKQHSVTTFNTSKLVIEPLSSLVPFGHLTVQVT